MRKGNTITVDDRGRRVPRLPFIELGEARYFLVDDGVFGINGFLGSYDHVKAIADLGFNSASKCSKAFDAKLKDYVKVLGILEQDANAMRSRAALCSPLTYTETYRDQYDEFVGISPCTS